jgi:4'-phosphopantetheinyl transferase
MELYITDINTIELSRCTELWGARAEKFERLNKEADKKRCLAGGLFINRFLPKAEILENEFGKPYANNGRQFNLSHSGDYVVFALSEVAVGCDIEKTRAANFERIGKTIFCSNENELLQSAEDKTKTFFELWTKKESLLKCMGQGFHRSSTSVDVSKDFFCESSTKYYFKLWHFESYTISVCSTKNDFPSKIECVTL